jgi:hypothetical protein
LKGVHCAAHTLQLAIKDSIASKNCQSELENIRKFVKRVKSVTYKKILSRNNVATPSLDVVTRWGSTYFMISQIFKHLEFFKTLCQDHSKELSLNVNFLEKFSSALGPSYICTKQLHEEQLTFGDFLKSWCVMKYKLEQIKNQNNLAESLLQNVLSREKTLFENVAFLSAIYMDQRFNFSGSLCLNENQKTKAQVN